MADAANGDDEFFMPLWQLDTKPDRTVHFLLNYTADGSTHSVSPFTIGLAIAYSVIGFFGLLGNLRVLFIIFSHACSLKILPHRLRAQLGLVPPPKSRQKFSEKFPVYCYVLSLCVVDTLVLAFVPLIIVDIVDGQWPAGWLLCRLYWVCESLNKVLSTFILAAFSGSCCLAACSTRARLSRVCVVSIAACVILSALMMIPVFRYADAFVFGFRVFVERNGTDVPEEHLIVVLKKCIFHPPEPVFRAFMLYTVTIGFGLTTVAQLVFYSVLLCRLLLRRRKISSASAIPFWNVAKKVIILVAFYFVCWIPYWATTIYTYLRAQSDDPLVDHTIVSIIHVLPYLNSAANPTLYSRLLHEAESASTGSTSPERVGTGQRARFRGRIHSAEVHLRRLSSSIQQSTMRLRALSFAGREERGVSRFRRTHGSHQRNDSVPQSAKDVTVPTICTLIFGDLDDGQVYSEVSL